MGFVFVYIGIKFITLLLVVVFFLSVKWDWMFSSHLVWWIVKFRSVPFEFQFDVFSIVCSSRVYQESSIMETVADQELQRVVSVHKVLFGKEWWCVKDFLIYVGEDGRVVLKDSVSRDVVSESDLMVEIIKMEQKMSVVKDEAEYLLRGDPNDSAFLKEFGEKYVKTKQVMLYSVTEDSLPLTCTLGGVLQIVKDDRFALLKKLRENIGVFRRALELLGKPFDISDYDAVLFS